MEVLLLIFILSVAGVSQGSQSSYTSEYLNNSSEATTATTDTANKTEAPVTLFRLFGGDSPCSGSLQVFYNGTWVPAEVTPVWNISEATLVCEKLDCGKAFDVQPLQYPNSQMQHSHKNSGLLECNFGGPDFFNCTEAQKGYYINRTNVICRGHRAVRLAGGRDACAGRVEVWEEGFWGTVCDDWWDMKDGDVTCAQVGCGFAVEVLSGGALQFGNGHDPILMDDVNCTGTERFLWECPFLKHSGDCGHKEDAGVICSESLGLPRITTEETWTTGTPTSAFILIEKTGFLVTPSVLGCFVLSFLLLLVMILYVVQFCRSKKRDMMPVQQTDSNMQTVVLVAEENVYRDDVSLVKVTTTNIPNNNNVNPQLEATQLVNDDSSFEADYEDYDFSVEPAASISTFQNSHRNRTDSRSPRTSTIPMTTLAEEEFRYTPNTPIYPEPLILNEDSSSTSSGESYLNNVAVNYNTQSIEDFSRSSDCSPKSYVVENGVSCQGDKDVDSAKPEMPTGPPPSQSEATMPQPHHWNQLHNSSIAFNPLIDNTIDSSSTSSGEYDENISRLNPKPQTTGVSENHQGNVCQDSSSDSDYDDIANYCN
ncbi:T-cell differentiation antigen CD6 isoform X3 [Acipenser ruthenus]|uniref:T-cell differentiation antigen CD6 isoform X3 n=1 Tax=Acipenser ruthenus TaxID=7906 RepID=UPI00274257DB|nr:T-cell differentiation antigen CD6 isoform X3 [Acipenser ruthenus]